MRGGYWRVSKGTMKTIHVDLGARSYDVKVGPRLLGKAGETAAAMKPCRSVAVIADAAMAGSYGQGVVDSIRSAGLPVGILSFPSGEQNKTLATYGRLMDSLFAMEPAIDRTSIIVAVGGGVAGDLAGFVAATALRGLRWVNCPTTLLADVDASVGGKTAVDHAAGKNLIGAFHQPSAVLIDVDALGTLDDRQLRSGLAECVKSAAIRDAALLDWIGSNVKAIFERRADVLTELVARNVAIKAAVVAADERESGQRADLNFGHTIGHAIETWAGLGRMTHGEAVSLGMIAANRLAVHRGMLNDKAARAVGELLERLGLPTSWLGLDSGEIWRIMQHDKKARGGRIRMVLLDGLAQVRMVDDVTSQEVAEAVESLAGEEVK